MSKFIGYAVSTVVITAALIAFVYSSQQVESMGISQTIFSFSLLSLITLGSLVVKRKSLPRDRQLLLVIFIVSTSLYSIAHYINDHVIKFFQPSIIYLVLVFTPSCCYIWYKVREEEKNENT